MGDFGEANGVTQFAGTTYAQGSLSQNGVAPGAFTGISITDGGLVVANYNNGETETVAQVPITTFTAPTLLQSQNGQAFTATNKLRRRDHPGGGDKRRRQSDHRLGGKLNVESPPSSAT